MQIMLNCERRLHTTKQPTNPVGADCREVLLAQQMVLAAAQPDFSQPDLKKPTLPERFALTAETPKLPASPISLESAQNA